MQNRKNRQWNEIVKNENQTKENSICGNRHHGSCRRTWLLGTLILALLICLLTGCGASAATDSAYSGGESYHQKADYEYSVEVEGDMALGDMVESPSMGNSSSTSAGSSLQAVSSRKLITTVNMETETEHYDDLMTWLTARIHEYGGYVEFSESYGNQSSRRSATITIRMPATSLDTFLAGLSEESNVTYQSRSVKDVTLNYVDVQSHKEALLVEQERLMALLEKAESLEDLLTIEERLTYVRYELESYESQLRTYDNQIDYSTVHLTIREVKVLTAPEPESFWERVTAGFKDNLEDVTNGFTEFAIGLLSSIPTLIVWAVILAIVILILRKVNQVRLHRAVRKAETDGGYSTEKKQKSKKRWSKGAKQAHQEEDASFGYAESDSYSQPEKKDGE